MSARWLLAIPVYNEEVHLVGVLRQSRRFLDDILVVDDGSTDATPHRLANEPVSAIIRHPENRGYGASVGSAFGFAVRHGYDWLITMDCDGQHEPSAIPEFVAAAGTDEFDVISGSRYAGNPDQSAHVPPDRREINGRITQMLNDRLGLRLSDAFCGFKAYRVSALQGLEITVPGYAMPLQFWVQAWRAGLRITELPVRLIYNDPGRFFGGTLDDPVSRYQHYIEVFEAELAADDPPVKSPSDLGVPAQSSLAR